MVPPIAIVGAGPCGLTLASLLERNSIDYILYERDHPSAPAHHKQAGVGGTLDIHAGTGQKALASAGLLDEFKKHARYDATGFVLATQEGEVMASVGEGRDAPEIDRHQLRQMLLDSIPADRTEWGHGVKALEKGGEGRWDIKFTNGSRVEGFRLIVGADGAWSKVRPALTSSKPIYSGAHFIEGRISHTNPSYAAASEMVGKGNCAALGSQKWLSVQQMADATYRVYMGTMVSENFARDLDLVVSTDRLREDFLKKPEYFTNWSSKLKRFIADAEGPFKAWPLYSLPVEGAKWSRVPGVTLLGDAAHLTTPNGEGVNIALYDALRLAEEIVKHRDIGLKDNGLEKAVAAYEEDMFPRAKDHIEDGNHMISMMFAEDAMKMWMRAFGVGSHEKDLQ